MLRLRVLSFIIIASMVPVGKGTRIKAQTVTGIPAVDSATVARSAWSAAQRAFRANDLAGARREVEHAATAWPRQQVYLWARATLGARARDTAEVIAALTEYANLGLGRDLHADTTFAVFSGRPWFAALVAAHDANRAVFARSSVRLTLSDSTLYPEGADYDPRTGKFYVASIRHRTIVEVSPNGAERELIKRDERGNGAVLGVRVDAARGVVWATMAGIPQMEGFRPADSAIAALVRIRISDGSIERRWKFDPARQHVLGDLALGPTGDVFVTDSQDPVLYRLRSGADSLEAIHNPLFRSLQGLAPTADGRFLYVADYSHGMLRVDLGNATVIRVDEPLHATTLGVDGIVLRGRSIIAIQNGVSPARVLRLDLNDDGKRIVRAEVIDRNWKIAGEPTIGTIAGNDFVYVANSQGENYTDDGVRRAAIPLKAPILLSLPLDR
jgi:sugar lactone lactonase YvrE